nr:unnamed protein product [Callosobruchus analis]
MFWYFFVIFADCLYLKAVTNASTSYSLMINKVELLLCLVLAMTVSAGQSSILNNEGEKSEAFNQTIYAEVPFNLNPHTNRHVLGVGGPVAIRSHIKILCCADDDSLEWIRTTSQNLFLDLTNRKPVLGGQQLHLEAPIQHDLLIGRTPPGKEQIVGKVLINRVQDVILYYVNSNSSAMLNANPYEVLICCYLLLYFTLYVYITITVLFVFN